MTLRLQDAGKQVRARMTLAGDGTMRVEFLDAEGATRTAWEMPGPGAAAPAGSGEEDGQ